MPAESSSQIGRFWSVGVSKLSVFKSLPIQSTKSYNSVWQLLEFFGLRPRGPSRRCIQRERHTDHSET